VSISTSPASANAIVPGRLPDTAATTSAGAAVSISATETSGSRPARKRFDWAYLVAAGGERGRAWLEEFRLAGGFDLAAAASDALDLLRRRRLDEGRQRLADIDRRLAELETEGCAAAIVHVVRRWYFAALAYEPYVAEDFDGAEHTMRRAHAAVVAALEAERALLPLASHCHEFRIQRARIARGRRRWREMWGHIEAVREMLAGRAPLCTLAGGEEIDYAALAAHYQPLAAHDDEEGTVIGALLDPRLRLRGFERNLHWVYAPAGFLIPYP
jgi:hypothetical protein